MSYRSAVITFRLDRRLPAPQGTHLHRYLYTLLFGVSLFIIEMNVNTFVYFLETFSFLFS